MLKQITILFGPSKLIILPHDENLSSQKRSITVISAKKGVRESEQKDEKIYEERKIVYEQQ